MGDATLKPIISTAEAASLIHSDISLMVGGFMTTGSPDKILAELALQQRTGITLIANDAAVVGHSKGRLVSAGMLKKIIASHVGLNAEVGALMANNDLEVELVPQGTLVEQIRCAGFGLGGVLTPTGVGTVVEKGKQKFSTNGSDYLLEEPIKADVALLYGTKADKMGNIFMAGSCINFTPFMAMAADLVIVEVEEILEVGELKPHEVMIPHIFVNYLVMGGFH